MGKRSFRVQDGLLPARRGGYTARKTIPADCRDAYGKLYGDGKPITEAWFNSEPVGLAAAKQRHREWLSEIEARVHNIRSERNGGGAMLAPQSARALAGEWYGYFVAQMAALQWSKDRLAEHRDRMWEGLHSIALDEGLGLGSPFEMTDKTRVRAVVADEGKTAQFLAAKKIALDSASKDLFLDYVGRDFFMALDLLVRRADGDFGEDQHAKQFPKGGAVIAGVHVTPWQLFERWIAEAKPAPATVNRWRAVFLELKKDFPNTGAAALLPEQIQDWCKRLVNEKRTAVTVRDVWIMAGRAVFGWAVGEKLITRNPFLGWRLTVPKVSRTRETKAFTDSEAILVLSSALKTAGQGKFEAARRWCPWLAAYSGARMGELTQLRGNDVFKEGGIWAMKLTPEAGTIKTRKPRSVPLHDHVIEQGFLDFVKSCGEGPLFYNVPKGETDDAAGDATNPKRPRAVKCRERLAAWVREIGVDDPELRPNHAWRDTFKQIGDRALIREKMLDSICGHAQISVGRGYGLPTLADKAQALKAFPRYKV